MREEREKKERTKRKDRVPLSCFSSFSSLPRTWYKQTNWVREMELYVSVPKEVRPKEREWERMHKVRESTHLHKYIVTRNTTLIQPSLSSFSPTLFHCILLHPFELFCFRTDFATAFCFCIFSSLYFFFPSLLLYTFSFPLPPPAIPYLNFLPAFFHPSSSFLHYPLSLLSQNNTSYVVTMDVMSPENSNTFL